MLSCFLIEDFLENLPGCIHGHCQISSRLLTLANHCVYIYIYIYIATNYPPKTLHTPLYMPLTGRAPERWLEDMYFDGERRQDLTGEDITKLEQQIIQKITTVWTVRQGFSEGNPEWSLVYGLGVQICKCYLFVCMELVYQLEGHRLTKVIIEQECYASGIDWFILSLFI